MERAFLPGDTQKLTEQFRQLRTVCQLHWRAAREFLTFFETVRFCKYMAFLDERTESKTRSKNTACLFHSDGIVSAPLSVIPQGIFSIIQDMTYLIMKVTSCHILTLVCHQGICAEKKSSPNLNHCGYNFYMTVPYRMCCCTTPTKMAHIFLFRPWSPKHKSSNSKNVKINLPMKFIF